MKPIDDSAQYAPSGSVVAIGMFDGVHRGHRRVLDHLRELGLRHGLPTVVLTFDPHPRAFLNPQTAPKLLCKLDDRIALLAATKAVDQCLVLPFDLGRSKESVDDFVLGTLVDRLGTRALVVGEDFACGHARRGNVDCLRKLGKEFGFDVHALPLRTDTDPVTLPHFSSTETRRVIQEGDLKRASLILGRPYELVGRVVACARDCARSGEAELPHEMCAPPAGTYVGAVRHERQGSPWIPAALLVSEARFMRRRTVRFVADGAIDSSTQTELRVRFLSKESSAPEPRRGLYSSGAEHATTAMAA